MIFNDFKGEGSIMKKKLAVLSFAAFLAAGSLTACGGSKEAQTTAAQTEAQTEAETANRRLKQKRKQLQMTEPTREPP